MPESDDRFARLFDDREADAALAALLDDASTSAGPVTSTGGPGDPGVTLSQRLRRANAPLNLVVRGVGSVRGRVIEVRDDAVVVSATDGSEWALPHRAVMWLHGLASDADGAGAGVVIGPPGDAVAPGLPGLLRRWAREGVPVTLHLIDGGTLTGTPVAARGDHLDLAEHGPDEPRRAQADRRLLTVPYASVGAVRRR